MQVEMNSMTSILIIWYQILFVIYHVPCRTLLGKSSVRISVRVSVRVRVTVELVLELGLVLVLELVLELGIGL